jgi:hypothetical protein
MKLLMIIKKMFFKQADPTNKMVKNLIDRNPIPLSDEEKEKWKEAYNKLKESLEITARSEAEKFDRGILTLSSIFLGLTLTFVDKIVPFHSAWYRWLLYICWPSFFVSIISILIGLLVNQEAIRQMSDNASNFFLKHNLNYRNFANHKLNRFADKLNWISFSFFVLGIGTLILFAILNVDRI